MHTSECLFVQILSFRESFEEFSDRTTRLFVAAFVYVEGWVAEQPLLPGDMFHVKGMKPLAVALFFQYGCFGIFLFYASF